MFERFTDRSRMVFALANQEAQRFNHEYIGPEHVLLGLIKVREGVAFEILGNLGADLPRVRRQIEELVGVGKDTSTGKPPRTLATKRVADYAIEEAINLNHNYVGTEHLLLGLLRQQEPETVAVQVLHALGIELDKARDAVLGRLKPQEVIVEGCGGARKNPVVCLPRSPVLTFLDKILTPCRAGKHNLAPIFETGGDMEKTVVRWCATCGSVTVDLDVDGRVSSGAVMRMLSPTTAGMPPSS